jgi:hypothetical protein
MKKLLLTALLFAAVLVLPTQADFFQCPPACTSGDNDSIVNGSSNAELLEGGDGNDVIFGGAGRDRIEADGGNDVTFGGLDSDDIVLGEGNDLSLPGPDDDVDIQHSEGGEGNDSFIILAGETVNCQRILGDEGFDVLHLIGFGPYALEHPFGLPEPLPDDSTIVVQDPIAGGYIIVNVDFRPLERINGLPSPNVMLLGDNPTAEFINQNCNDIDN